jgi:hypothetical protein
VVSTVRGSARHGGGQGAAAQRHREQQQLSTWCTGRGGEAAGGERAAGRRRRTLARDPSTRAACVHALRAAARVQVAKGKRLCRVRDAAAASGGPAAEDIGARPKHKGRLARAIGSVASRAYLLRQVSRVAHSIRTEDLGELKVERRFRYIIFDSSQVTSSHNRSLARSAIWRATRGVFPLDMIPLCPPGRGRRSQGES